MIETLHGGPESYSRSELCRALGVSRSGLYDHGAKAQRPRRLQDKELAKEIELLFSQSRRTYGARAKQKQQVGTLRPKKTTTFYGRQPEEKSHWSGEAVGPWKPVAPTKVVEVRYDHFGDSRFRHGCNFLRVREDKLAKDCLLEQVVGHTAIQNINALIDAGLATAGTNRK